MSSSPAPKAKLLHQHAHMAFVSDPVRQPLGGCDSPAERVSFPCGARQIGFSDPATPQLRRVLGIDDGLRIDRACAQRERLHRSAQRLRLPDRGELGQRTIEGWNTAPIEAAAVPSRPFARQRRPCPLRVVRPVGNPAKPHGQQPGVRRTLRRPPGRGTRARDRPSRLEPTCPVWPPQSRAVSRS